MVSLCQYKNVLGEVGKGVHSYRIFNIAIVDTGLTVLAAYIIYLFFPKYNFWYILLGLFVSGIIVHHLFCVRTTLDKVIFRSGPEIKN
jgi:hypothetical protein